jgi:two-component system, cell cycle response regulator CpdR
MAKILLAEDDHAVREFVTRGLQALGHDVEAVPDGGAAVIALMRDRYDLVLTDIVMPVMDGIALALKVASDWPATPVLMMSGYAEERKRAYNLSDLIVDVLAKPFGLDDLRAAVDKALT